MPRQWAENKQLGMWVTNQRTNYQKGILSKDRIKRLEKIGFEWVSFAKKNYEIKWEELWSEKLGALKEYKNKYGNCNVPSDWPDRQLVNWVTTQQTRYRNGKLSDDRIKRLKDLGFKWNIHN